MPSFQGRSVLATSLALALALGGCSQGSSIAAIPPKAPASAPIPAPKAAPTAPPGHVLRAEVDRILVHQGPPWVLRRVMSEVAFGKDGRFAGWRIAGLPEEWRLIDLRPGDV